MTYSQSGFELENTSGRHATVEPSKIGDIKIRYHREIPDEADYCATWDGTGMSYVSASELPGRVRDHSADTHVAGSETPVLSAVHWSPPIPKRPVFSRTDWTSPVRSSIAAALYTSTKERILESKDDDTDGTLPFVSLTKTSIEGYEPGIERGKTLATDIRTDRT